MIMKTNLKHLHSSKTLMKTSSNWTVKYFTKFILEFNDYACKNVTYCLNVSNVSQLMWSKVINKIHVIENNVNKKILNIKFIEMTGKN